MPLTKKTISYDHKNLLAWVCCLPCVPFAFMTGLCAYYCCDNRDILDLSCHPCTDDTLKSKARVIAGHIDTNLKSPTSPLKNLKIPGWEKPNLTLLSEPIYDAIYNNLLIILNNYNFGKIKSTDLSAEDVTSIAEQLCAKIFLILPSHEKFHDAVLRHGKAKEDLNSFLAEQIANSIDMNFMMESLNYICDRNATPSVVSVGIFKEKTPSENNLLLNHQEEKKPAPGLTQH